MASSPGWRRSISTTGRYGRRPPPLGDYRNADRLADPSEQARADERRALDGFAARLEAIDDSALSAEHRVDAAMMAGSAARRVFELDELREHTWNPLQAN